MAKVLLFFLAYENETICIAPTIIKTLSENDPSGLMIEMHDCKTDLK